MRRISLFPLFALLALSATALGAPKGAQAKKTKDPKPAEVLELPEKAPKDAGHCPANDGKSLRYLARTPATPLVTATAEGLTPGAACCRTMSHKGLALLALDAHGRPVGEAKVEDGEPTRDGCFALEASITTGQRGQLWVEAPPRASADDELPSPRGKRAPSVAVALSKDAQKDLGALVDAITAEALREPEKPCEKAADERLPLAKRSLVVKGENGATTAVVGGHVLVVATLVKKKWSVAHIELAGADQCAPRRYQPVAAFDMDGDGTIEIVARQDGDAQGTIVLSPDADAGGRYRVVGSAFR